MALRTTLDEHAKRTEHDHLDHERVVTSHHALVETEGAAMPPDIYSELVALSERWARASSSQSRRRRIA